jgi:hypothetical protein
LIAGVPVQGCAGDPSHANLLMFLGAGAPRAFSVPELELPTAWSITDCRDCSFSSSLFPQ